MYPAIRGQPQNQHLRCQKLLEGSVTAVFNADRMSQPASALSEGASEAAQRSITIPAPAQPLNEPIGGAHVHPIQFDPIANLPPDEQREGAAAAAAARERYERQARKVQGTFIPF